MRKFLFFIGLLTFSLSFVSSAFAQQSPVVSKQEFITAKVLQVLENKEKVIEGVKSRYQKILVQFLTGIDKGSVIQIQSGLQSTLLPTQIVTTGEVVILSKTTSQEGKTIYQVYDAYRMNTLLYYFIIFVFFVIVIAGWKGLGSLLGLCISLGIIVIYIVPQILSGADPLLVSIIGSVIILIVTTYLAHGVSKQTTVALVATFLSLMLTAWLSSLFVGAAHITGYNEEAATLQFGSTSTINIRGLLLGGIIIGTLGALNDITTTQAAAVFELAKTDAKLTFSKLFRKGYAIGKEHVVSMVNTLVLAYAGSSLILFLFLVLNPQNYPLWVIINTEDISGEIVRTIAGSFGLILAVPLVTLLAALLHDVDLLEVIRSVLQ